MTASTEAEDARRRRRVAGCIAAGVVLGVLVAVLLFLVVATSLARLDVTSIGACGAAPARSGVRFAALLLLPQVRVLLLLLLLLLRRVSCCCCYGRP
jgi:hypothetical protein